MEVDEALTKVGGYKRWHLVVFILLGMSSFMPLTLQNIAIVFIAWEPQHHCKIPPGRTFNGTIPQFDTEHLDGHWSMEWNSCEMYVNENSKNSTQDCTKGDGYYYYNANYTSIVTQYNLICKEDFLAEMAQTFYMLGTTLTDLITSYFTDSFGRKYIHILSHVLIGFFGMAEAFSMNYVTFVVLRTLTGMVSQVAINSGLTYLMELFPAKHRTFAGIGFEFTWVGMYLLPCLLTYLVKDWKTFQIIASALSFTWIIYLWVIPESVSWLAANNRFKEAEHALVFMAKANGVATINDRSDVRLNREQLVMKQNNCELETEVDVEVITRKRIVSKEKVPLTDMFFDKKLRIHLLVCNLLWFSNAVIYYGLTLSTPYLGQNRFFNYSIMGLVEIPANIITLFVVKRFGRKVPLMVLFIIAGLPLLLSIFVENSKEDGHHIFGIVLGLALIAKFGITGSFSIMLLYVKELFPTNLRSSSTAWCSIAGGIGAMIAPFTAYMAKHVFWVPNCLFAAVSIIAALSVLVLPETMNKPLPLNTAEVYTIYYETEYNRQ